MELSKLLELCESLASSSGGKLYKPETKEELKKLVQDESIKLGDIDTSLITDMSDLFKNSTRKDFSGINRWNVSKVMDFKDMFYNCKNFDRSISDWEINPKVFSKYPPSDDKNINQFASMFYNTQIQYYNPVSKTYQVEKGNLPKELSNFLGDRVNIVISAPLNKN
ncbi:TPA: BspA family leucine-rich repeat surface protein [Campylobacter jejuni]